MKTRSTLLAASLCLALFAATPALAQRPGPGSELSAASALPLVLSITAPALLLGSTAGLSVVAVETASDGTVWVLERASDGARTSVRLASLAGAALSLAAGTTVQASANASGWVLHAAGKALAFVPNELGRTLLHNERITR